MAVRCHAPGADAFEVCAADGVVLRGLHRAGVDDDPLDRDLAVVVLHGFGGGTHRAALAAVVDGLAAYAGVLALDLRGHGRSGGRSTLGVLEVLDVDAAVRRARLLGYRRVVTCGFSMGAAAALRHAALVGRTVAGWPVQAGPDAVVSVSAPSRWWARETAALRRLHWLVGTRTGRLVSRAALGARVGTWAEVPPGPAELIADIAPASVLLVHGDRDPYFPLAHAEALVMAAGTPSELWVVPDGGHAEAGVDAALLDRLGRHLDRLAAPAAGREG